MTLAGTWQNEYGSRMVLTPLGANLIWGSYSSTTGSTGTYRIIGHQQTAAPSPTAGQAVALAIAWHSIVAGPSDPSWYWSSGLSGQISIQNGQESLTLAHALVASSAFPGLTAVGTYIDKLTYFRTAEAPSDALPRPDLDTPLADPLQGTWQSADGTVLMIRVHPHTGAEFGWVQGKMAMSGGVCAIEGVTDIKAQSGGLTLQSTAITALPSAAGPAIAFAGCLDLTNDQLTLTALSTHATAPNATYVATAVSQAIFARIAGTPLCDRIASTSV